MVGVRRFSSRRLLLALAALAAVAALPAAQAAGQEDPAPGSAQWLLGDVQNLQGGWTGRLTDQFTNPEFARLYAANARKYLPGLPSDPRRPRLNNPWVQGLQPSTMGDPYRLNWEQQQRGDVRPVTFLNRNGAEISGHLWAPRGAQDRKLPGVVMVTGSLGGVANHYWWAAQGLAEAGYLVLTFDMQTHGQSETFDHGPDGMPTCDVAQACQRQLISDGVGADLADFQEGTIDAIDYFLSSPDEPYANEPSTHNPFWELLDRDQLGLAGHSAGGRTVTWLQDWLNASDLPEVASSLERFRGEITGPMVKTVVGWDPNPESEEYVPRVPMMQLNAESLVPVPAGMTPGGGTPLNPDPEAMLEGFNLWRDSGLDTMQVTLRGSSHFEFAYVPYYLPASRYGERVAMYYTLAWFDRYLKGDSSATDRLTAQRFEDSADRSSIGAGQWNPIGQRNVPYKIAGQSTCSHLSLHHKSSYWFSGGPSEEAMRRPGCTGGPVTSSSGDEEQLERNKRVVAELIDLAYNQKRPDEAAAAYVAPDYVEHQTRGLNGREGFAASTQFRTSLGPEGHVDVKRVIAQGDMVVTHSQRTRAASDIGNDCAGVAMTDFWRLDANGQIAEHWNVSEDSLVRVPMRIGCPNSGGFTMFDGPATNTAIESDLAANAATAMGTLDLGFNQRKPQEAADRYLDDWIQHNQGEQGKDGFVATAEQGTTIPGFHLDFKRVVAEGDMVVIHSHWTNLEVDRGRDRFEFSLVDIFRLNENGKVVEHWDIAEPIVPVSLNGNGPF